MFSLTAGPFSRAETNDTDIVDDTVEPSVPDSSEEPIDTATGNNYFTEQRLNVPCPGIPLELNLKYQSVTSHSGGLLGKGWTHSYDWSLDVQSGSAILYTGEGNKYTFTESGGTYEPLSTKNWTLEPNDNDHVLGLSGGIYYRFASNGVLTKISDAWGNVLSCSYGTNGCLEAVTHSNGRQLVFSNRWNSASTNWCIDSITVSAGASLEFSYNSDGQFTQVVETVGSDIYTSSYAYTDGFLTSKTDGAGHSYVFGYETGGDGKLTGKATYLSVDGWYEHTVDYVDSSTSDLTYTTRGTNQIFRYSRNSSGKLETKYGPAVSESQLTSQGTRYTYAANGTDMNVQTLFDNDTGASYTMQTLYDDSHNPTNLAAGYNNTNPAPQLVMQYDPVWQQPVSMIDAEGDRTEIIYTNALPLVQKEFYNATNSYDTHFAYTTNGLLKAITNANNHVTEFSYNSSGDLLSAAAESGPVVSNSYNSLGFVTRTEILSETGVPTGRTTQYDVDGKGRITKITDADGLSSTFRYNALGYLTNGTDRAGRSIDYTYAPTRKLTSITKYLYENGSNVPVRVSYNYDEQFNTLSITEPRNRYVESYQLDIQDRVRAVTNIEGQVMTLDYSVGSFVTNLTRFDQSKIQTSYDDAGRKDTVTYLSSADDQLASVDYSYHDDGQLKTLTDGATTISNTYNQLNLLTRTDYWTPACKGRVTGQYDAVGNQTYSYVLIRDVDNWPYIEMSETSSYDEAERLASRGDRDYAYDSDNGKLASVSNRVNGLTCSYDYNLLDQLTNMVYKTGTNVISSLQYTYDDVGMIKSKTITGGTNSVTHRYTYDSLDRLVIEEIETGSETNQTIYTYDLAGNRLTKVSNGWKTQYTLGTGNRLDSAETLTNSTLYINGWANEPVGTDNRWGALFVSNLTAEAVMAPGVNGYCFFGELPAVPGQINRIVAAVRDRAGNIGYTTNETWVTAPEGTAADSVSYFYDAAGCLTNLVQGTNSLTLNWDERYRLASVTSATSAIGYSYDVLGRRISRFENGTTNYFVYNGNHVVAEVGAHAYLKRTYAYGPGIDNIQTMTVYVNGNAENKTQYYYIKDHQNSVIALTDSSGNIAESYEYDAWGNPTVFDANGNEIAESAVGNRFLFQGREYDFKTGLYYFRARWYDPQSGRWLSKDPIGISGGLNLYAFCGNNPVNFRDPFGLCEDGWNPDWGQVGEGLKGMLWGAFQFLGGGLLTQTDSPMIGPMDIIGAGIAVKGVGDMGLGYADFLGGLTGVDTSDVPDSMVDGVVDAITGSDEAGDVAEDIYNTGADYFLGTSPP